MKLILISGLLLSLVVCFAQPFNANQLNANQNESPFVPVEFPLFIYPHEDDEEEITPIDGLTWPEFPSMDDEPPIEEDPEDEPPELADFPRVY